MPEISVLMQIIPQAHGATHFSHRNANQGDTAVDL
jgi:hypothetical protein